jgi:peptidoglycan/xylan/chitin deacetylase (PgdA/CDA1 family)
MTKCQDELSVIPEVAAALKNRWKPDEQNSQPLAGLQIALTINGLVRSTADPDEDDDDWCYTENTRDNFDKLLAALKQNQMPPTVDFVIGQYMDPELHNEWVASGNLVGNLTYDRKKTRKKSVQEFIDSVARNERELTPLMEKAQQKRKYFRYPGLRIDPDAQKRAQIHSQLKQMGYVEVPATIEARDGLFAQNYCAALARGDQVCANYVKATFRSLLTDKLIKARSAAGVVTGRDIKHILLVRANQLTCDSLSELLALYKSLGVKFVSLDEALQDSFYSTVEAGSLANTVIEETRRAQINGPEKP